MDLLSAVSHLFSGARKLGFEGTVQLLFPGGTGLRVDISTALSVSPSIAKEPDITIRLSEQDCISIAFGLQNVQDIFSQGNIKISGRLGLAARLPALLHNSNVDAQGDVPEAFANLFPTTVLVSQYGKDISQELASAMRLDYSNTSNTKSRPRSSKQSQNTFVLNLPEFARLKSFAEARLKRYVAAVLGSTSDFIITQSWLNISGMGDSHQEHTHPNSIVSGVFYLKINSEHPPIQFHSGTHSELVLETGGFNSPRKVPIPLNAGEMILFPSTLRHSISINESEEERISLSFNTFAKGALGTQSSLTYLPSSIEM